MLYLHIISHLLIFIQKKLKRVEKFCWSKFNVNVFCNQKHLIYHYWHHWLTICFTFFQQRQVCFVNVCEIFRQIFRRNRAIEWREFSYHNTYNWKLMHLNIQNVKFVRLNNTITEVDDNISKSNENYVIVNKTKKQRHRENLKHRNRRCSFDQKYWNRHQMFHWAIYKQWWHACQRIQWNRHEKNHCEIWSCFQIYSATAIFFNHSQLSNFEKRNSKFFYKSFR